MKELVMRVNWRNFPIPEGHLFPLLLGGILSFLYPSKVFKRGWFRYISGLLLLIGGVLLVGWTVKEVNEIDVETPAELVTSGPYTHSRNPMYIGWTSLYLGISFLFNSMWSMVFLPFVQLYTHYYVILQEESYLEERFGEEYMDYRTQVRRYL
jgi:protein-S-isoprenylcysteine O-methyltransferase Ste14